MLLYHITKDVFQPETMLFRPRVPCGINAEYEDVTIPRISLSVDVEHCIQAISPVDILIPDRVIRVYTYDVTSDSEDLIPPYILWKDGLVFDAAFNLEFWCTKDITMSSHLYKIKDWDSEIAVDYYSIPNYSLYNILKQKYAIEVPVSDSETMCSRASDILLNEQRFSDIDELDDIIAETFPCQQRKVHNVTLEELTEGCLSKLHSIEPGVWVCDT